MVNLVLFLEEFDPFRQLSLAGGGGGSMQICMTIASFWLSANSIALVGGGEWIKNLSLFCPTIPRMTMGSGENPKPHTTRGTRDYQFDKTLDANKGFQGKNRGSTRWHGKCLTSKKKRLRPAKSGETHALLDIARKGTTDSQFHLP
jgi:hypothetical protein